MVWSTQRQLVATLCGLTSVVVICVSLTVAWVSAFQSTNRIRRELTRIAEGLNRSDFPLTTPVLLRLREFSGAEFIVVDGAGKLTSSSLALAPEENELSAFGVLDPLAVSSVSFRGKSYLCVSPHTRKHLGQTVYVLLPESLLREDWLNSVYPSFLVGAIALAAAVMIGLRLATTLSVPIQQLSGQVQRISRGEVEHVELLVGTTELRDLASSINRMVDDLNAMSQAIRRTERSSIISQLGAGLIHQLRNSMAGANLAIQVHEKNCHSDAESLVVAKRQLRFTSDQLQRVMTLRGNLSDLGEPTDLAAVVQELNELFRPSFEHRQIDFRVSILETPLAIFGNADQLRQLITELLVNALDAAGEGGWVELELKKSDDQAVISVSDSGPGVSANVRDRMFEPFVTEKPEGIGLGLATAKRIAEAHGGSVQLEDGPATCFCTCLPIGHSISNSVESQTPQRVSHVSGGSAQDSQHFAASS